MNSIFSSGFSTTTKKELEKNIACSDTTKLYFELNSMDSMAFCVINRLMSVHGNETTLSKCRCYQFVVRNEIQTIRSCSEKKKPTEICKHEKAHFKSSRYI